MIVRRQNNLYIVHMEFEEVVFALSLLEGAIDCFSAWYSTIA